MTERVGSLPVLDQKGRAQLGSHRQEFFSLRRTPRTPLLEGEPMGPTKLTANDRKNNLAR